MNQNKLTLTVIKWYRESHPVCGKSSVTYRISIATLCCGITQTPSSDFKTYYLHPTTDKLTVTPKTLYELHQILMTTSRWSWTHSGIILQITCRVPALILNR